MTTWILGASDPEMAAIEGILREAGAPVLYAALEGRRVSPRTAYDADGVVGADGQPAPLPEMGVVLVECGGPALDICQACGGRASGLADGLAIDDEGTIGGLGFCGDAHRWPAGDNAGPGRCDHHRPGDPGFGRPPEDFLAGSTLGQVLAELARRGELGPGEGQADAFETGVIRRLEGGEWAVSVPGTDAWGRPQMRWHVIADHHVLVAAADHCLAAAYAGRCPGVDPEALLRHRAAERGEWLARGPGEGRDDARAAVAMASRAAVAERASSATSAVRAVSRSGGWDTRSHTDPSRTAGSMELTRGEVAAWTEAVGQATAWTRALIRTWTGPRVLGALDLREVGALPELPTACALEGVAALYRMVPAPGARDPRVKVGIIGAGEGSVPGTAPIEAFLGGWAAEQGLTGLYGDATRGYCGGYE